ncbi:MAG: MgtC/SapB family protein [Phycisphaerales bacterium]
MLLRLAAAIVFAWALGWERKRSNKRVGARTLILTGIGAAGFIMLGLAVSARSHEAGLVADPTRVLSYLVVGIGFLGGGMIVQHRNRVRGMTTAAAIWVTAAIGAACGLGEFALATMLAVISYVVLELPGHSARRPEHEGYRTPGDELSLDPPS